jgi:hypothetical protein
VSDLTLGRGASDVPIDDSREFAAVERAYLHRLGIPFEWLRYDTPSPRHRPAKPLHEVRVGLISTSGAHLPGPSPFTRSAAVAVLPATAEVTFTHVGFDTERTRTDPDVVWPVASLQRLVGDGVIGSLAPHAVSMMGAVFEGRHVVERAVAPTVEWLRQDAVDLALLVPA